MAFLWTQASPLHVNLKHPWHALDWLGTSGITCCRYELSEARSGHEVGATKIAYVLSMQCRDC